MTIKERILEELVVESVGYVLEGTSPSLSYEQLATRLDLNEPSVRRACMELYRARKIHYTRYEPPVTVAIGNPGVR